MPAKRLAAADVSLPRFDPGTASEGELFDLSSHRRARKALEFGLSISDPRFNVFVLGIERSGRMTATREFLEKASADTPAPDDWLYLNNFQRPSEPRPVAVSAGTGREFRDRLTTAVRRLTEVLAEVLGGDEVRKRLEAEKTRARAGIEQTTDALRSEAKSHGFDLVQTEEGPALAVLGEDGQPLAPDAMSPEQRAAVDAHAPALIEKLQALVRESAAAGAALQEHNEAIGRAAVDDAVAPVIDGLDAAFAKHPGLSRWLIEFRADVIENFRVFMAPQGEGAPPSAFQPATRYAVNLLVDNADAPCAPVVVEPNVTYENLFGWLEYRQGEKSFETDFTLVRPGALHRANGGILVLRADSVAERAEVWRFLKEALRDGEIRIEEPHRTNGLPVAGAPKPRPVPLAVKVVFVASPHWFYTFYSADPEFESYFKIKADIDPDMEASEANCHGYAALIRRMARAHDDAAIDDDAIAYLLGLAARWAGERAKLTAQVERIEDMVAEAHRLAEPGAAISRDHVVRALERRRKRNARLDERNQEAIAKGAIAIVTRGEVCAQVNALTVINMGDHSYGGPSRVTARASVGRHGVINLERDVNLGGPIQQKAAMVLHGYLAGRFARRFPLSFDCSITFEQNYGGVEGDSASLAELLAILSDLSGLPLRQDLGITGSVNQHGRAQAIGGAHVKIEGFYRTCESTGGLTGEQGVVLPAANERNLILRDDVAEAVEQGRFHLYSVETIDEAVELFTGQAAGEPDGEGNFPPDSVNGLVASRLAEYDRILTERMRGI
jgi:predicted ATP-dependent protease